MFTAANVSKEQITQKKWIRVPGYRFRYQLTCPLGTGVFLDFLGNALQLFWGHIDPKTANMSQFLQLGPLDFDPDLGYVRYFGGIDSANNHSHISKTTSSEQHGHVGWALSVASHPTLTKCNWFLECTPNLPVHPRASSMMRSSGRSWGPFFLHRFVINAVFDLSPIGVWK